MTRRLLLALLGLVLLTLIALIVPLGITNQRSEQSNLTNKVERDALAAATLSAAGASVGYPKMEQSVRVHLDQYAAETGARVVVVDGKGNALLDTSESNVRRSFASRPEIKKALAGESNSGTRNSATLGYRLLYVAVPMTRDGKIVGAVRITYPLHEVDELVNRYWLMLLAIACAVLAATFLVALMAARWVVKPLADLSAAAHTIGEGDLSVRANTTQGPPEIRALATELNESVSLIETMVHDQSRFVADAAHQLRTPLQAMLLRLENLERAMPTEQVADDVHKQIAASITEVERLSSLVTSLLVLARADEPTAIPANPDGVDICDMLRSREAFWSELASPAGVKIKVHEMKDGLEDGLIGRCTPIYLEQSLDNLVDNAISVSPPGGIIDVVAKADGDKISVHVIDCGPGMTEEQRESAFTRFSTTRPTKGSGGGFGLGLSIAKRLTELDGGSIRLDADNRGGIDAVITIPANR